VQTADERSFFMSQPDLTIIESEGTPQEQVSVKGRLEAKPKQYEIEKVELSKNIQKFDKKPRVYTENPYSFNQVAKRIVQKRHIEATPTQSADQLITHPTYNTVGKFLGVDTVHDWNKYANKVYEIVEWAKFKSGEDDISKLLKWIGQKSKSVPSFGQAKRIEELYLFAHLELMKHG
jgi:hypothetical protein